MSADEADRLFEEFVQAEQDGSRPDRQGFLQRAGPAHEDLQRLFALFDTLEGVRSEASAAPAGSGTDGHPAPAPPVPDRIGRYRDLSLLGRGGLSCVYLATDPDLKRRVALKVLFAPHIDNRRAAAWMLNEGRSLARLQHDGVVGVFEVSSADGQAYIAMEHIAGPSLRDVLVHLRARAANPAPAAPGQASPGAGDAAAIEESARALAPLAARCEVVARIAEALDYCHLNGVIHRDIKPSNVLLLDGRRPRLIDFGLAHLESPEGTLSEITQNLVGTPAYIAPEQVHNNRTGASEQSDQFALGIVLFELLTLANPFQRETREKTLAAILETGPPRLRGEDASLPADLERICDHCLQRDPAQRYARLADLAADLRAFIEHRAISLQPAEGPGASTWLARYRRSVRLGAAFAGALLVVLVLLLVGGVVRQWNERRALVERLAEVESRLPELSLPGEFSVALLDLARLREGARSLDASLSGALSSAAVEADVAPVVQAASRALAATLRRERSRYAADESAASLAIWGPALALERELCPECTDNAVERASGSVLLPATDAGGKLTLLRLLPDAAVPAITWLHPVTLSRPEAAQFLPAGLYRLYHRRDERSTECELDFASTWQPRRELRAAPPDDGIAARWILCGGGETSFQSQRDGAPHLVLVPAFCIQPRCVTWGELADALGQERVEELLAAAGTNPYAVEHPPARDLWPGCPAIVSCDVAQDYAAVVGARLPCAQELRAADGVADFHFGDDPLLAAEWTASPADPAGRARWVVLPEHFGPRVAWERWTEERVATEVFPATGFRVALTTDR